MDSDIGCMDVFGSDEKWRILAGHHACRQVYEVQVDGASGLNEKPGPLTT
jgi:hypothetical protein